MSADGERLVADAARDLLDVLEQARNAVEPIAAVVGETPPTWRILICEECGPVQAEQTEGGNRCLRHVIRASKLCYCEGAIRMATVREVASE